MKITIEGPAGPRFKKIRVAIEFDAEETAAVAPVLVERIVRAAHPAALVRALGEMYEALPEQFKSPITVEVTRQAGELLDQLLATGFYGFDIEDVVERIIYKKLREFVPPPMLRPEW